MEGRKYESQDNTKAKEDNANILQTQWQDVINAFLNPFTAFLFIGAFLLILVQAQLCVSWASAALTLLIGLMAGVAINRFEKVYTEYSVRRPMIRRGITAIRRLGVLIEKIRLLESKIDNYQTDIDNQKRLYRKVIKDNLDDLKNDCLSLQLAGFSSIEDWTEILPDASIATLHAQVIAKFLHDREMAMEQVRDLHKELKGDGDQSSEEKIKLEAQLAVKEKELSTLTDILFSTRTSGLWTIFSTEPTEASADTSGEMYVEQCRVCGQSYYKSPRNPDPYGRCTRCVSEGRMPESRG